MPPTIVSPAACEVRAVIRFLSAKGVKPIDIHREICEVYGQNIMSDGMVRKWVRAFKDGRTNVHDEQRSGRPSVVNEDLVQKVDEKKFSSPKKKRMRKSSLSASEKVVICNIYKLVEEMWPKDQFMYSKDVAMKTAETAGVHISTVYKVMKEKKTTKCLSSPKTVSKRLTALNNLDELDLNGIRRKVHTSTLF
ncbi:hypothetical protein ACJJTC_016488 [Scirpophaga incertulas]